MSLALYERGRPAFYALQRFDPRNAYWTRGASFDEWRFGDTGVRISRSAGAVQVRADLDIRLAGGERATGVVEVEGCARIPSSDERAPVGLPRHDWSPLLGRAHGRARLSLSGEDFSLDGRGYCDRNGGGVPLWDLDIRRWLWGRVPFADEDMIFFTLWRRDRTLPEETLLLFIDREGRTRRASEVTLQLLAERSSWTGMQVPLSMQLRSRNGGARTEVVRLQQRSLVDEGPFYLRMIAEASRQGERALGFVEAIAPDRVDLPRHRPFVRMRVHDLRAPSSMWLPLFSGRRAGRLPRFCRSLLTLSPQGGVERV